MANPLGLTVPVNVAEFVVMFVAYPVVAVGAAPTALVLKDIPEP